MIAAIAVLIKDATKLTLGQPLTILAPHTVESLIRQPPDRWLSNARLIHYQSLLQDTDRIQFGPVVTLNPATLLPTPGEAPLHDCHQILVETHGTRPDLTDQPMKDVDLTWYTDGSSYLQDGERWAGAAITTDSQIVWASALPGGTSAQRAQLIALTQALQLAEDTFSGWTEAFPTKKETANIVAKKLLEEIFPRYGMPEVLGSDNGPAFVSQVSQSVAKLLGIDWKLHCAYRPQSSGQVEIMNRTIKEALSKLLLETGSKDWVQLLPLALYRARNTPGPHGLTPFEILYGAPPPAVTFFEADLSTHSPSPSIQAHLQALQLVQQEVWKPLAAAYQEKLNIPS
ncbi:uncharacterized protein LOC101674231 isoform X2 [Mustela putorius furo]|uniref:Uncharacterized protein LOC101674231 isoform X2 n=1 Tax=Mustela putorius furo TaxID=9669 RepID=A0A8U0TA74_MUSPF|nr:uncharacterized protein LOC101674231 isoform X2 [Mustela putorius furo]